MPVIEATYIEFLDAAVAATSKANELGELKRLVLIWSRRLVRSRDHAGQAEDHGSGQSSSPESHTADLATLDDCMVAGAVSGVFVSTHDCVSLTEALRSELDTRM